MKKSDISGVQGELSLHRIVGMPIVAIEGTVDGHLGFPIFQITHIVFADGSTALVSGVHEMGFIDEPLNVPNIQQDDLTKILVIVDPDAAKACE